MSSGAAGGEAAGVAGGGWPIGEAGRGDEVGGTARRAVNQDEMMRGCKRYTLFQPP